MLVIGGGAAVAVRNMHAVEGSPEALLFMAAGAFMMLGFGLFVAWWMTRP